MESTNSLEGGKNVAHLRIRSIQRSKAAWDSLEEGKTVACLRICSIQSSKAAWDSLEGGKTMVYPMKGSLKRMQIYLW